MKKLSILFSILAILLSDIMCYVVGYNYCNMKWGIKYSCFSAPASVAFLGCIPYLMGIAVCVVLAVLFCKKSKNI